MSFVRYNFLNWQPDQEDYANDGLSVADNVIHNPDGYQEVRFSTSTMDCLNC
jgi:hypothetical protein